MPGERGVRVRSKPRIPDVTQEDLVIQCRLRVRIWSNVDDANLAVTAFRDAAARLDEQLDPSDDPWAATQSNQAAPEAEGDISKGWSRSNHDTPQLPTKAESAELRRLWLERTPLGEVGMAVGS